VFRPPMTNKVRKPHDEFEKKGVIVFAELTFVVGAYLRRWGGELPPLCGIIAVVTLIVVLSVIIVVAILIVVIRLIVIIRRFPYIAMAIALGVAVPNKAAVATLHQPRGLPPFFRSVDDDSVFHFILCRLGVDWKLGRCYSIKLGERFRVSTAADFL